MCSSRNVDECYLGPSFEDTINSAVSRAISTLRNVESGWVKDMNVEIQDNRIIGYKANVAITFVLEEGEQPAQKMGQQFPMAMQCSLAQD